MGEGNGLKSTASTGEADDEVLFMGIIDILQAYTTRKMLEGMVKRTLHRVKTKKDKDEVDDNTFIGGEVRPLDHCRSTSSLTSRASRASRSPCNKGLLRSAGSVASNLAVSA